MRSLTLLALLAAGVVVAMESGRAFAQDTDKDVEAKIESALKAYKSGQTGEAMSSLQEAISMIQKSTEKGLAAFFPKAPEGWKASKLDSRSLSTGGSDNSGGSWTTLSQSFTRKKDSLKVTVSLANSPQMIKAQKGIMEAFKSPDILKAMNADPNHQVTLIDQAPWAGLRQITKGKGQGDKCKCEIVVYSDSCVLTMQVDSDDQTVLDTFWTSTDLKGLAGAAPKSKKTDKSGDKGSE